MPSPGIHGSFTASPMPRMSDAQDPCGVLGRIADVIESRLGADPDTSYVARLALAGREAILKKIGEEATETVLAAQVGATDRVVYETADLWFHTLVMLAEQGLRPEEVLGELERRFGVSGVEEKASRGDTAAV